jgi:hypothetical protein
MQTCIVVSNQEWLRGLAEIHFYLMELTSSVVK